MSNIKLLIFLSVLLLSLSKKIIEIPFIKKDRINGATDPLVIFNKLEGNSLLTEINIGTPEQKLELNIVNGNHFFYVIGENATIIGNKPDNLKEYKNKESTSYKISYDEGSVREYFGRANYMYEKISINNIIFDKLTLVEVYNYENKNDITTSSGIIGFGVPNKSEKIDSIHSNFILNLKEQNLIDSYNFFFIFDNETHGKVIIGAEPNEYDNNKYPNKVKDFTREIAFNQYMAHSFMIDEIKYDGISVKQDKIYASLSINTDLITLNKNIKALLDDQLFNNLIDNDICKEYKPNKYEIFYYCKKGEFDKNKLGNLEITNLGLNKKFIIDLKKLFEDYGDYSLFLAKFDTISYEIKLGLPFFKENILLFNQDTKLVGLYHSDYGNSTGSKSKNIIIVLVIIIFALIICGLIYILLRKKSLILRKIRITEIEDTYEYSPMSNIK